MDFSNVVQERGYVNAFDFFARKPEHLRNDPCIRSDASRMPRRVWVAGLDCCHHKIEQFPVRALKLCICLVELPKTKHRDREKCYRYRSKLDIETNEDVYEGQSQQVIRYGFRAVL